MHVKIFLKNCILGEIISFEIQKSYHIVQSPAHPRLLSTIGFFRRLLRQGKNIFKARSTLVQQGNFLLKISAALVLSFNIWFHINYFQVKNCLISVEKHTFSFSSNKHEVKLGHLILLICTLGRGTKLIHFVVSFLIPHSG